MLDGLDGVDGVAGLAGLDGAANATEALNANIVRTFIFCLSVVFFLENMVLCRSVYFAWEKVE